MACTHDCVWKVRHTGPDCLILIKLTVNLYTGCCLVLGCEVLVFLVGIGRQSKDSVKIFLVFVRPGL